MVNMATVKESEQELADRVDELCSLLRSGVRMTDQTRRDYLGAIERLNARRAGLRKTLGL